MNMSKPVSQIKHNVFFVRVQAKGWKRGKSLYINIPKEVAKELGVSAGDYMKMITLDNGKIILEPIRQQEIIEAGVVG